MAGPTPLLDLTLRPHRSLSPRGFAWLMGLLCAVSFVAGLVFFLAGAWPVLGFLGVDVLLVWLAFRANYARGRQHERVVVYEDRLEIERVDPKGRIAVETWQPYWLKVDLAQRPGHPAAVRLRSHGKTTWLGAFLPIEEREPVARMIDEALARARYSPSTSRIE
ncbi:MAG: DUF2244 domain-containing protein [Tagaea sp.]|nr:DUF2244 domain-containing protein [Azospirillum sp.]MCA3268260.1 DUF2244 domain-containing protein [Azospirillum sp.]MCZ8123755.1 DUF2244 domain-containing protein [Magnetospirillum sp.]